jgi:hypothetical protein
MMPKGPIIHNGLLRHLRGILAGWFSTGLPEVQLMMVPDFDPDWRAVFEERAAVLEFDLGLTRAEAERIAEIEQMRRRKRRDDPPA